MEIAVVGATAVVTVADGDRHGCADRDDGALAHDPARARRPRPRSSAATAAPARSRQRGAAVAAAATPISDVRGSADYRRAMAAVIARRAIETALSRARRGGRMKVAATLTVNGIAYPVELDPGTSLLAAVRDVVGLTGSKEGCDDSECGACMMLLDGKPVNSCSYLALQAEGSEITTVEGLADGEHAAPAAGGVPRAGRRPVRLLHARACWSRRRRCSRATRARPRTRCGSGSPATSAAAPATTASSRPC